MKYWLSLVFVFTGLYLFSLLGQLISGSLFFVFHGFIAAMLLAYTSYVYIKTTSKTILITCILVGIVEICAICVNLATMLDFLYSSSWLGAGLTWYYDNYEILMSALAGGEAAALLIYPASGAMNGLYKACTTVYRCLSDYFNSLLEGFVVHNLGFYGHQKAHDGMPRVWEKGL